MSRSYKVVAVATAVFAALLTASAFLWLSARANASETKVEAEPVQDVRVVTVSGDGATTVVDGDSDAPIKRKQVYVVKDGVDADSAFLGVQLSEETKYKDGGARVDEVVSDSPAEKAGLKEGDIIVSFNGAPIHGPMRLSEGIHGAKPGDKVDLGVVRGGAHQKITVEMGERPKAFSYWFGDDGKGFTPLPEGSFQDLEQLKELPGMMQWKVFGNRPKLGIRVVETTPDLREHLGASRDGGILVGKVMPGTPAEKAGLKVGDVVVSVDGAQVQGAHGLLEALEDKDGKTVDLEIIRDRKTMHLKATLPEAKEDDDDSGPQAWYWSTPRAAPAPPAPPAPPSRMSAPAPPAPPAPPARPAAASDVVEAQRAAELALVAARRHARERVREDLVAAQLRAEREVTRLSTADLQTKIQAELQAALSAKNAVLQAELERETANAARAGMAADALDHAREASEKAREEVRQRLQGLEIY